MERYHSFTYFDPALRAPDDMYDLFLRSLYGPRRTFNNTLHEHLNLPPLEPLFPKAARPQYQTANFSPFDISLRALAGPRRTFEPDGLTERLTQLGPIPSLFPENANRKGWRQKLQDKWAEAPKGLKERLALARLVFITPNPIPVPV